MALKAGAKHVTFQDFNNEVLEKATKPVIELNIENVSEDSYTLLPGAWQNLASH